MGGGYQAVSCPVCAVSHRGLCRSRGLGCAVSCAGWCGRSRMTRHEVDISGAIAQRQTTLSGAADFRTLAPWRCLRTLNGPMTMDNTSSKTPPYDDVRAALIALGETPEPERVLALQAKIGDSLAAPGGRGELITRNPNFFHYVLGADGEPRAAFDVSSEAHAYAKRDSRYEVLHRAELTLRFGDRYRGYYAGDEAPVQGMAAGHAMQANGDRAAAGTLFDIQFEATGYTAVDLNGRELSEAQAAGYTATARAEGSLPGHVMAVVRGQISEDDAQDPGDRKVFATVTLRVNVAPGEDVGAFAPPRVLLAYMTDLMAMDAAGEVPLTLTGGWQVSEIEPADAALAAQSAGALPPARARVIRLDAFDIAVTLLPGGGTQISSSMHDTDEPEAMRTAINGVELMIQAHAEAGLDITTPAYRQGIEACVDIIWARFPATTRAPQAGSPSPDL